MKTRVTSTKVMKGRLLNNLQKLKPQKSFRCFPVYSTVENKKLKIYRKSSLPLSRPEKTSAESLRSVCWRFLDACSKLGGPDVVIVGDDVPLEDEGELVDVLVDDAEGFIPDTVLNCNWISITWSPRRILRLRGALPQRNSFTCVSFRDSSACIIPTSGRCVWNKRNPLRFVPVIDRQPSLLSLHAVFYSIKIMINNSK